jgi:hypothetical protein
VRAISTSGREHRARAVSTAVIETAPAGCTRALASSLQSP